MTPRAKTSPTRTAKLPPFRNPAVALEARVEDLLSRMTLDEKIKTVQWPQPLDRLGVNFRMGWAETLHGVAWSGIATVFPQPIAMGATFDTALVHRIADAISDELRAKYNRSLKLGDKWPTPGLLAGAPTINIFRDPRWGRGMEGYGEDPVLMARMAVAFIEGLQGNHPRYIKAAACVKHYAVHSGPESIRHNFNAKVSDKDLYETYLPAFKAACDAGAASIMGSYNLINGAHGCAGKRLLTEVLRDQWHWRGMAIPDSGATDDIIKHYKMFEHEIDSCVLIAKSGMDLGGGPYRHIKQALDEGRVTEDDINRSARNVIGCCIRVGLAEKPEDVPFAKIPMSVVNCDKHRKLAHEAAVKGMVLLKNRNGILPLKTQRRILVTGPNAYDNDVFLGNYFGESPHSPSILEALVERGGHDRLVNYRKGCMGFQPNTNPLEVVTPMAKGKEAVIAVMGLTPNYEGEEFEPIISPAVGDRVDIGLPAHQVEFVKNLCSHGKPVILVITSGSPVVEPELFDMVDAIIYAWYPGEQGGNALADIIYGNAVPSGRLPVTVPMSLKQVPAFEDYSMVGRTYRYLKQKPLFPFGFGLSYTTFAYDKLRLDSKSIRAGRCVTVSVDVTNTGKVAGDEVVQLYLTDDKASVRTPQYALKDFRRVHLKPGQCKRLSFCLTPEMMKLVDKKGQSVLEPGSFTVHIGGACPSPRSVEVGAPQPVHGVFAVR